MEAKAIELCQASLKWSGSFTVLFDTKIRVSAALRIALSKEKFFSTESEKDKKEKEQSVVFTYLLRFAKVC